MNRIKKYINKMSILEKVLTLVSSVYLIIFVQFLNIIHPLASDILAYSFLIYSLFACGLFIFRKNWLLLCVHVLVFSTSLYSTFWFLLC